MASKIRIKKQSFSWINPKLEIRNTGKYGKGFFATENIKKGEIIHIFKGEKISLKEGLKRVLSGKENIDDIFQIGKKTYIDLDYSSRIFNHSCDPNAGIRKKDEMFALENIKKGEEVVYDYSATVAPTKWSMKCKCGSKNCRKILGDISTIPQNQLKKYRSVGSLQNYMVDVLKKIRRDRKGNVILPEYELAAIKKLNQKVKIKI